MCRSEIRISGSNFLASFLFTRHCLIFDFPFVPYVAIFPFFSLGGVGKSTLWRESLIQRTRIRLRIISLLWIFFFHLWMVLRSQARGERVLLPRLPSQSVLRQRGRQTSPAKFSISAQDANYTPPCPDFGSINQNLLHCCHKKMLEIDPHSLLRTEPLAAAFSIVAFIYSPNRTPIDDT